jgi:MFS family permease
MNRLFSKLGLLGLSNFFFFGSYAYIGVNALFLHLPIEETKLRSAIILGMGLFAGLQVGGVWLISFFGEKWTTHIALMLCTRMAALCLIFVPVPILQIVSFISFGLSQAIYYKKSRYLLGEFVNFYKGKGNLYILFGITTNLAFLVFPLVGAFLLEASFPTLVVFLLGSAGAVISSKILRWLDQPFTFDSAKETKQVESNHLEVESIASIHNVLQDVLRFLGFVLPYAIMISAIPIKASAINLEAKYSAIILGFNPIAVILIQLISIKTKILEFSLRRYDVISLIAFFCTIMLLISNFWLGIPFFVVWSVCEAYQLPNIDHYLFSYKKLSGPYINRILAFDAFICLVGPYIASVHIGFWTMPALSNFIENMITNWPHSFF